MRGRADPVPVDEPLNPRRPASGPGYQRPQLCPHLPRCLGPAPLWPMNRTLLPSLLAPGALMAFPSSSLSHSSAQIQPPEMGRATAAGSTHTRPGDLLRGTDLIPRAPPVGVHRSTDLLRVPLLQFT